MMQRSWRKQCLTTCGSLSQRFIASAAFVRRCGRGAMATASAHSSPELGQSWRRRSKSDKQQADCQRNTNAFSAPALIACHPQGQQFKDAHRSCNLYADYQRNTNAFFCTSMSSVPSTRVAF
eukprot:GHRQ01039879.1.p1 GENE.GHRQ01039879.1~~GHRQ01039879.1.p1  ORF type:complete len:122 (+),score=15.96 GHRQ01039879.1:438-803(+)